MDALHCSAESLHVLLRLLASQGLKNRQLPKAELPADVLLNSRARIPLATLLNLLLWAREQLNCPHLTLDFGMALALHDADQDFSLNRYCNHSFTEKPTALLAFDLHLRNDADCDSNRILELRWRGMSGLSPDLRGVATQLALAWLHQRWLPQLSARHEQLTLCLPAPPELNSIAPWLPVNILTPAPFTALKFPQSLLEQTSTLRRMPTIRSDCDNNQCLLISHKAANLLRAELDDAPPLDELARRLNLSERTCKRRLQDCGTHYQKLLGELRLLQASYWLQSRQHNVTAVASLLGYSSVANFSKAFKKWCGYSPSQVRHGVPAIRRQELTALRSTIPA